MHRLFVSQETLDRWLGDDRAEVDGEQLTLKEEGVRYRLVSAVHFLKEVADGGDGARLVGKVKSMDGVTALGGEYCQGSVILGDDAYEVIEGFLAEPVERAEDTGLPAGTSMASAAAAALGDAVPDSPTFGLFSHLSTKGR